MNKTFVKRKANWVSRVGHSTLLAMANISTFSKEYNTMPQFMRQINIDISYISLSQGLSELGQLGLVSRDNVRRHYDNGMVSRTFIGSKANIKKADYEKICKLLTLIYESYSVEKVAALATLAYMMTNISYHTGKMWFSNQDYLDCLRPPIKAPSKPRSFSDAGHFVTVNPDTGLFCINSNEPEVLTSLSVIDRLIETNKPWNQTK